MKIIVESTAVDNGVTQSVPHHVVYNCYMSHIGYLQLIIDFAEDATLYCTSSTSNSIGFRFGRNETLLGNVETVVTLLGETPNEIAMIKGNQFTQKSKGNMVIALLPWYDTHVSGEIVIANWTSPLR